MKMGKPQICILMSVLLLSLLSCSSSDLAPGSISGKEYKITITGGSGAMSSTGSSIITFEKSGTYTIIGDDVHTTGDTGTYIYKKTGANTGMVTLTSNEITEYQETDIFEFTEKNNGKYSAKTTTGDAGEQTGTFYEI